MEKRIARALFGRSLLRGALLATATFGCSDGGQTYDDGADGLGDKRTPPVVTTQTSDADSSAESDSSTASEVSSEDTLVLTPSPPPPPPPAPPPPEPTQVRCSELSVEANSLLEEASRGMDNSCVVDADCVVQNLPRVSCNSPLNCWGDPTPMSTSARAKVEQDLASATAAACAEFEELGCQQPPPLAIVCPSQVFFEGWCDAGTCASRQASCEDAFPDAWSAVERAYELADRTCTVDHDCTLFTSNGVTCTPGFGARCDSKLGVNVDAVATIETKLSAIAEAMCVGYDPAGCAAAVDPIDCPNVQSAVCMEQQCVAVVDAESAPDVP